MPKLSFAVVCSSNMNRSMEAHRCMSKRGYAVESFGSGNQVKLPGSSADRPNVYSFSTKYDDILTDLKQKDRNLYTQNGVLNMLDRNRRIKDRPQRFQDYVGQFDVIITLEERVYDQIMEDFNTRESETMEAVHVINLDIQDNHEEATIGAFVVCELSKKLEGSDDLDNDIDELLQDFEERSKRRIIHSVHFY
uniref:RNA polymerase II subunit A C-terminal domain phosphatase SSU72 n=1 Tax=Ciona intestinalis TaxID=7719 RepID=A0A1W5BJW2_CIOIN|nr:RNA polymerase II subunit A C-terminal domain phosphatase SSU72 [Ciona intestinalis]|eukprot:XP_026694162.1 RNA polymerase II subunit A C-terminal domain phosphatase SSU72 [Ciona intestinalis]